MKRPGLTRRITFIVPALLIIALMTPAVFLIAGAESLHTSLFGGRTVRVVDSFGAPGTNVVVPIALTSLGDEVAASFSVNFDTTVLTFVGASLGSGAPGGTALTLNTNQVGNGRLGVLMDALNPYAASPPDRVMMNITFQINPGAGNGTVSQLTFGNSPVPQSISDILANLLPATYAPGTVTVTTDGPPPSPTPTPGITPTPTPTPTPVPSPTPSPIPTPTPVPSPTPSPSVTPTPTPTPAPSPTPSPSPSVTPTPDPSPSPTPQVFSVSGRVYRDNGTTPLPGSLVTIIGPGFTQSVTVGSFGAYIFENVPANQTYTVRAFSKRFRFPVQVIELTGNLTDIDFVGME